MHQSVDQPVITFSFGENWKDFLRTVSQDEIRMAQDDLVFWLGEDAIRGRRVLDIGSGSGLHSLAFYRLGAAEIVSFDYDPNSVEATRGMWESAGHPDNWRVMHGSVLDRAFLEGLASKGDFDIVYSWGVLHHTGSMWEAIDNAARLVPDGGRFFIALYASVETYEKDLALKQKYNRASKFGKRLMVYRYLAGLIWRRMRKLHPRRVLGLWRRGRLHELENPFAWKKARGMNIYHDVIDWLGGLPYEVASEAETVEFLGARGFLLERAEVKKDFGTYLFRRSQTDREAAQ